MKELIKDDMKFLSFNDDNVSINFSTAFNKIDFKKSAIEGKKNIQRLEDIFALGNVLYLNQIHSDKIIDCKDNLIAPKERLMEML